MKNIVIIGGGASGLLASIVIKKDLTDEVNVTIVERLDRIGKKILATGNGRCNFSNELLSSQKYNNPEFVRFLFKRFGYTETVNFFEDLGLISKVLVEGRTYPVTESAASLLDVMRQEVVRLGINVEVSTEVKKIKQVDNKYYLECDEKTIEADYVVLATGGKASPALGSNGSGYNLLKNYKINIKKPLPGLVGLKVENSGFKRLDGLRTKGILSILDKKTKMVYWKEAGEIQFKSDGISGIVTMHAATYLNRRNDGLNKYLLRLDVLPDMNEESLMTYLLHKQSLCIDETIEHLFTGLLNKVFGQKIIKDNKFELTMFIKDLTKKDFEKMIKSIKNFEVNIKDTYDFDKAQVTIGGVDVKEVKKETLELFKLPRVYITGELLDIDGECGGYNLQWAWTSGYIAGVDIVKKVKEEVC